jgi:hypothetical protein
MQMSNGLSNPIGLWLGHLLFDTIFTLIMSTIIVIIFAAVSNQFHGLGFLVSTLTCMLNIMLSPCQWFVLVLYGIAGALFAYCVSLSLTPLAAFAAVAGYQIIMFLVCVTTSLTFFAPHSLAL